MPIIPDVRPHAHTTPPPSRRIVASYTGTVAGLRAALRSGEATGTQPAGSAR